MADAAKTLDQEGSCLMHTAETDIIKEGDQIYSDKRYSLEECDEIGKMVMNTIQSDLELYFSKLDVENVEDPHIKAWKYLEQTHAFRTLQVRKSPQNCYKLFQNVYFVSRK